MVEFSGRYFVLTYFHGSRCFTMDWYPKVCSTERLHPRDIETVDVYILSIVVGCESRTKHRFSHYSVTQTLLPWLRLEFVLLFFPVKKGVTKTQDGTFVWRVLWHLQIRFVPLPKSALILPVVVLPNNFILDDKRPHEPNTVLSKVSTTNEYIIVEIRSCWDTPSMKT